MWKESLFASLKQGAKRLSFILFRSNGCVFECERVGECTGGAELRGDRKGDVRSHSRSLLWCFYYLLPLEMKEHRRQQYFSSLSKT